MIKKRNMRRLFDALMILSLAIPILAYSGCYGPEFMTIEVREDGWGVVRSGGCGCAGEALEANGDVISPAHVASLESQGAQLVFASDQARANWQARGYSGRGGGDEQQSQPPQRRKYTELPGLDVPPDGLPSNKIELGPGGGGGRGSGKQ